MNRVEKQRLEAELETLKQQAQWLKGQRGRREQPQYVKPEPVRQTGGGGWKWLAWLRLLGLGK